MFLIQLYRTDNEILQLESFVYFCQFVHPKSNFCLVLSTFVSGINLWTFLDQMLQRYDQILKVISILDIEPIPLIEIFDYVFPCSQWVIITFFQ